VKLFSGYIIYFVWNMFGLRLVHPRFRSFNEGCIQPNTYVINTYIVLCTEVVLRWLLINNMTSLTIDVYITATADTAKMAPHNGKSLTTSKTEIKFKQKPTRILPNIDRKH
jgi:hypothetical protein